MNEAESPPDPSGLAGFAVAAFTLTGTLMTALVEKNVLSKRDAVELVDHVALLMEERGLSDLSRQVAHGLMEGLRRRLSA